MKARKARIFYYFTMALALAFSLAAVSAWADNTVLSSTMIFEGTLTDMGGGVYSGVLPMVDEQAVSLGDGVSGYDVYARNGATAWFGTTGPTWSSVAIPNNHDAWDSWSPDTPDWYQYSLNLYQDGGSQKWAVRNHAGATEGSPCSTAANGVPMSGVMDWSNMYAEETDVGFYILGSTAKIPGGAAAHGGGAQCWDMDWSWGSEVVPLAFPGFDVAVQNLGGGQYRVTMTPSGSSSRADRVGILDPWFAPLAALIAVAIASIVFIRRRSSV